MPEFTIVHSNVTASNLLDVHKRGCADLKRVHKVHQYDEEHDSMQELVESFFDNQLAESPDSKWEQYQSEFYFLPCAPQLPQTTASPVASPATESEPTMPAKTTAPAISARTAKLVEFIKTYADEHYTDGGWDVIAECWDDEKIAAVIDENKATTQKAALRAFSPLIGTWADQQADARISAGESAAATLGAALTEAAAAAKPARRPRKAASAPVAATQAETVEPPAGRIVVKRTDTGDWGVYSGDKLVNSFLSRRPANIAARAMRAGQPVPTTPDWELNQDADGALSARKGKAAKPAAGRTGPAKRLAAQADPKPAAVEQPAATPAADDVVPLPKSQRKPRASRVARAVRHAQRDAEQRAAVEQPAPVKMSVPAGTFSAKCGCQISTTTVGTVRIVKPCATHTR